MIDALRAQMEAILRGKGLCADCGNETLDEELLANRDGAALLCRECRRARDERYREKGR